MSIDVNFRASSIRRCLASSRDDPVYFSDIILADIFTSFAQVAGDVWLSLCMLIPGHSILSPSAGVGLARWILPTVMRYEASTRRKSDGNLVPLASPTWYAFANVSSKAGITKTLPAVPFTMPSSMQLHFLPSIFLQLSREWQRHPRRTAHGLERVRCLDYGSRRYSLLQPNPLTLSQAICSSH